MDPQLARLRDIQELSEIVYGFVHRDKGNWDRLRSLFAPGAMINISWFSGQIEDFVERSKARAGGKMQIKHQMGSPLLQIRGDRALGETDVTIHLRTTVGSDQQLVDVVSQARFFDRFERLGGHWKITARTAIYEKDRADCVDVGGPPKWEISAEQATFPIQYRALAMILSSLGIPVSTSAVLAYGEQERILTAEAESWLAEA